jgi:hypothetical protein
VVGLPVIALSATGQITVIGIRAVLGVGVLAYGLLGLWITRPSETGHDAHWVPAGLDLLMIALGLLLIYRVVTSDSISLLLGVIGWLAIGSGFAFIAVGLVRRLRMSDPDPQGQRPQKTRVGRSSLARQVVGQAPARLRAPMTERNDRLTLRPQARERK